MEIFNNMMSFFNIVELEQMESFADFAPWFVQVLLALILLGVFIRCFFSAMVAVSRGIR